MADVGGAVGFTVDVAVMLGPFRGLGGKSLTKWKKLCVLLLHRQITYVCSWINMYTDVLYTCCIAVVLYILQTTIRSYRVRSPHKLLCCILRDYLIFALIFNSRISD